MNFSLVFSPDGKTIASASQGLSVRLWDVQTGGFRATPEERGVVNSIAFSPDGKVLAVGSWEKDIILFDSNTLVEKRRLMGHLDAIGPLAFTPDGKSLISGSEDRTVRVWDVQTGTLKKTINFSEGILSFAFSPDGDRMAVGNYGDGVSLLSRP